MALEATRERILGLVDIKSDKVFVREWNIDVTIRGLTALEREEYDSSIYKSVVKGAQVTIEQNNVNSKARLVVKCVVDAKGVLLFKPEDASILGKKSAGAIEFLFNKAQELSGLSPASQESLQGNSLAGQNDGSRSS